MFSLTQAAAAAVANCPLVLVLPGLTDLSLETAAALADHEGPSLVLGGLRRLELPVAEALAGYPAHQELLLPDLESLDSIPLARRWWCITDRPTPGSWMPMRRS